MAWSRKKKVVTAAVALGIVALTIWFLFRPHILRTWYAALGEFGGPIAEAAVPNLVAILKDQNEHPRLRSRAASTLGDIKARAGIPALVEALSDKEYYVRRSAVGRRAKILQRVAGQRFTGPPLMWETEPDTGSR